MLRVIVPEHLAIWVDPTETIEISGAVSYRGPLPPGRVLEFPLPAGSGDISVTLAALLSHERRYTESASLIRGPVVGEPS